MPGNIGPLELAIVLVIALIVLGPKRLPEVGRSIGKGLKEFKESLSGGLDHDDDDDDDDDEPELVAEPEPDPVPAPVGIPHD